MKNADQEKQEKQVWQTPEVVDLDVNNETTKVNSTYESGGFGES